jgi:hypothetical protein
MKLDTRSMGAATALESIRTLVSEVTDLGKTILLSEAKLIDQAAARKLAREKKQKAAKARASKSQGHYDSEKAEKSDEVEKVTGKKGEVGKADFKGKRKKADPASFKNGETFHDTPEDAHLHTDGKCDDKSLRFRKSKEKDNYAKSGDKGACDAKYPVFGGKEEKPRLLGAYKAALTNGDTEAQKRIEKKMRAIGLHPKGHLYHDMPGCEKVLKGERVKGLTAKMCKPHGEGGPDEWSRQKGGEKSANDKFKRSARPRKGRSIDLGHDDSKKHPEGHRVPSERAKDSAYAKAGGSFGELKRGYYRTLGKKDRETAGAKEHDFHASLKGASWRKEKAENDKKQRKS